MIPWIAERRWPEVHRIPREQRASLYLLARQHSHGPLVTILLAIGAIELVLLSFAIAAPTGIISSTARTFIAPMTGALTIGAILILFRRPFSRRAIWRALNMMGIATCDGCGHDCRGARGLTCPECGAGITNPAE